MPDPHPSPVEDREQPSDARIRRIEEALGFAEHAAEELSAQVASIGSDFTRLRQRFEALEKEFLRIRERGASGPDLPHAEI